MNKINIILIFILLLLNGCGGHNYKASCNQARNYSGPDLHTPFDISPLLTQPAIDREQPLGTVIENELEHQLDWIESNTQITGITAAVGIPGQGLWRGVRGLAQQNPAEPLEPEPLFWWMSIGKMFTAAIIIQLVEEEKLRLDEPISRWFPQAKYATFITVEQLLMHTSGIYSFQNDDALRLSIGYKTPTQLLDVAFSHKPDFCPGEAWSYSNSGYVMLGLIIESIEQKSYADVVDERIVQPLKLTHTRALNPDELPSNLVLGEIKSNNMPSLSIPSTPFGAGAIVGTADDMVIFLQALLTAKLYSAEHLQQAFNQLYPMYDPGTFYGKGVMLYDIPRADARINWLGHSGGAQTANAILIFDLDTQAYVAVAINDKTPAGAAVTRLLMAIKSAQ